jgi:hypothetical protein
MKASIAAVVAALVTARAAYADAGPDPVAVEKAQHEHRIGVGEEIAGIPLTILGGLGLAFAGYAVVRGVSLHDNYAYLGALYVGGPSLLVTVVGAFLWHAGRGELRDARALEVTPTVTAHGGVGVSLAGTF